MKLTKMQLRTLIESIILEEEENEELEEEENEEAEAEENEEEVEGLVLPDTFSFAIKSPAGVFEVEVKKESGGKVSIKVTHNGEVMTTFGPSEVIALAFYKMEEILGDKTKENKILFNNLGALIKVIDVKEKAKDAMGILRNKREQRLRFIEPAIQRIKKFIQKLKSKM